MSCLAGYRSKSEHHRTEPPAKAIEIVPASGFDFSLPEFRDFNDREAKKFFNSNRCGLKPRSGRKPIRDPSSAIGSPWVAQTTPVPRSMQPDRRPDRTDATPTIKHTTTVDNGTSRRLAVHIAQILTGNAQPVRNVRLPPIASTPIGRSPEKKSSASPRSWDRIFVPNALSKNRRQTSIHAAEAGSSKTTTIAARHLSHSPLFSVIERDARTSSPELGYCVDDTANVVQILLTLALA